jgi:WD40 repeat protein
MYAELFSSVNSSKLNVFASGKCVWFRATSLYRRWLYVAVSWVVDSSIENFTLLCCFVLDIVSVYLSFTSCPASCSADKTVKIWKCYKPGNSFGVKVEGKDPKWLCVCTLSGFHSREIYDINWSTSGHIVTACGDDCIRVFEEDPSSAGSPNDPIFRMTCEVEKAHSMDVNSVSWNPKHPDILASCSDDGTVKLWKLNVQTE